MQLYHYLDMTSALESIKRTFGRSSLFFGLCHPPVASHTGSTYGVHKSHVFSPLIGCLVVAISMTHAASMTSLLRSTYQYAVPMIISCICNNELQSLITLNEWPEITV